MTPEHLARTRRLQTWFAPARFGLFYHWGLFTGGGNTSCTSWNAPLRYASIAELEAAAENPETVAANLVETAVAVGARYITYTVVHSCGGWAVMYPTRVPGFRHVATRDYLGAVIRAANARDIRVICYLPGSMGHWDTEGGPWVDEPLCTAVGYAAGLRLLVAELAERYGAGIAGFWLDGLDAALYDLPAYMHQLLPEATVAVNNFTRFQVPGMDLCTTEFLADMPDPIFNRPSGLVKAIDWLGGMLPPMKDFNEDIPTCNDWWHGAPPYNEEWILPYAYRQGQGLYQRDPHFWIKEMLSSLGIRGQWNYTMGLGPMLDGTVPAEFQPMMTAMSRFMAWAGEAIYGTTGGEDSPLQPGWCNEGAFCPITISTANPKVIYVHVVIVPTTPTLQVQNAGYDIATVEDVRTGARVPFAVNGCLEITPSSWEDVGEYGAQIFRVTLA